MKIRKLFPVLLACLVVLLSACGNSSSGGQTTKNGKKIITIKALTYGTEKTRVQNLVEASKTLNQELKKKGKNIQVKVEPNSFNGSWDDYRKKFILGFKSHKEPDIYAIGHEDIAWLAKDHYIKKMDSLKQSQAYKDWLAKDHYIKKMDSLKQSQAYKDVYPKLWSAVKWNGHIWGALQDTEVRPVFFRKDILKKLGWSDAKINQLPQLVKEGKFTLQDMTSVAKQAKDKGLVKWGILHRPTSGPDFHMIAKDFGAKLYDPKTKKLVLDEPAILKSLQYFQTLTQKAKVTPTGMTSMQWKNVHQMMIDGQALFNYGGTWNVFNYMQQGAKYKDIMKNFGFMLVPAASKGGQPLTLSHPFVYTESAHSAHPDLVKRLLELVAAPKYQAKHAVKTYHLPFTKGGSNDKTFKANKFLSSVTYMLNYTTFLPNNANFNKYSEPFYKAIQSVELGKRTPKEALKVMEQQVKSDIGSNIEIKK